MEWSKYNYLFFSQKTGTYLLYSSLSNMLLELGEEEYQGVLTLKNNPDTIDLNNEEHKVLHRGKFFIQSNETEQNKVILSTLMRRFDNTILNLTLAPTRACNFECIYCYEEDRIKISMSKEVQKGIIDFIKRHNFVQRLGVCWYGGEPTLAIPIIKNLTEQMKELVPNYTAMIVTNGYNMNKLIDNMEDLNIKIIQITLDGLKNIHNSRRMLKGGGDTFDKILSNLDKLSMKSNINISLRMNVDDSNADEYVSLYKLCKERYKGKVHLYPGFVHASSGGCKVENCYEDSLKKAEFLKKIFQSDSVYTNEIYPFRTDKNCVSTQRNGYLIGPEGELYKCWHHLGHQDKIVGSIYEKNVISNIDKFADAMLKKDCIFDVQCTSCVLFPSCMGGCPDMKQQGFNQCIPAKSMLEDFLEIHYAVKTTNR
jgi:uncharacterized protein